ncbi:MAG: hypothetical protein HQ446_00630 [Polaromonas sp.]|nr:hypothetical protein [Polaromonas sp.]
MDNEHKQVMRGKEAQMVLDNEAFKSAFAMLKDAIDEKRSQVSVRDPQGLVIAALWERIHKDYEAILVGLVRNGEFSQRKIDIDKLRDEPKAKQFMRKVLG